MEILYKNNIRICFCPKFSSVESIISHSHDKISMTIITCELFIIPKLARHERLHKIRLMESLLFQLYCGSFFSCKNRAWLNFMFTLPHIKIELWSKV